MAKIEGKPKGFRVSCPICGDGDMAIQLDLNDLASCTCGACGDQFSPRAARTKAAAEVARWDAVIAWIALAETGG